MSPDDLDLAALQRVRTMHPDLEEIPDDDVKDLALYAMVRLNLAVEHAGRAVFAVLTEAFDRFAAAYSPPEED